MLRTTLDAVKAALRTDSTLKPTDLNRLMLLLRNDGKVEPERTADREERIIRRAEFARRVGRSKRAVDAWAAAGTISRVKLPGRTRSIGFRESDLLALIAGREVSR